MRIGVIGDAHRSAGGSASWVLAFAKLMNEIGVQVDYIGDKNYDKDHRMSPICVESQHNSFTEYNVKTPAEVLQKNYYCQKRLFEQFKTKVYDAFIVQRMDFLPVLHSFALTEKVPVWVPNHDISIYESLMKKTTAGTEAPYRLLEMNKMFLDSGHLNILVSSDYLGDAIKQYSPKTNVWNLPIEMNSTILSSDSNSFENTSGVLWVGSATSYKNPDMMFKIVESNPDINFTMVFNTTSKGEMTKIEKKYKAKNLTIKTGMPLSELIEEYKKHRFGIVTSNVETFCIVAQEHLWFHPTFICTKNVNNFQNIFEDSIHFDGVSDFTRLLNLYYNDENYYNTKIANAKKNLVKLYSHDVVVEAYKKFKEELQRDFTSKNTFRNFNTMGDFIKVKLNVFDEVHHVDILMGLKYNDLTLGQHSMFSQLQNFEKVDTPEETKYRKKQ